MAAVADAFPELSKAQLLCVGRNGSLYGFGQREMLLQNRICLGHVLMKEFALCRRLFPSELLQIVAVILRLLRHELELKLWPA
jgi:hypothetical protein